MARYFFDADDDCGLRRDTHGVVLADDGAALRHALAALIQMADNHEPDAGTGALTVVVRDENGVVIRGVTLWLQDARVDHAGNGQQSTARKRLSSP